MGAFMKDISNEVDADTALKSAISTYGRFEDGATFIDPRKEIFFSRFWWGYWSYASSR